VVNGILIPPSHRRSTRRWMVELRSLSSCVKWIRLSPLSR